MEIIYDLIEQEIKRIVSQVSGKDIADNQLDSDVFIELNLDSIKSIEIIVNVYELYRVQINDYKIKELRTIRQIAKEVYAILKQ